MSAQVTAAFKGATAGDILAWRRPIASGIVLGVFLAVWFTYVYFGYTFTTFACRTLQLLFIAGGAMKLSNRALYSPTEVTARMDRVYEKVRPHVQSTVERTLKLATWSDPIVSAKFFLATFVVAFIGNWMRDTTLILLIVIALFTIPKVYEQNKQVIDEQIKKVTAILDKYLGKAKDKGAELRKNAEATLKKKA